MNKTYKAIIIILGIFILALIIIFGILEENKRNNTTSKNNDINNTENTNNEANITYSLSDASDIIEKVEIENISIPKLNLNNNTSNAFNEKLMAELYQQEKLKLNYIIKNYNSDSTYSLSYKSYKNDDILLISAVSTFSFWPLEGDGNFYYDYAYNLKENKEISIIDALKALKINEKQIVNITDKCYKADNGSIIEVTCDIDLIKTGFLVYKWYHINYENNMIDSIKFDGVIN